MQGRTLCTILAGFAHSDGPLPMHSDEPGRYPVYPALGGPPQSSADLTSSVDGGGPMVTDPPALPSAPATSREIVSLYTVS